MKRGVKPGHKWTEERKARWKEARWGKKTQNNIIPGPNNNIVEAPINRNKDKFKNHGMD